MEELRRSLASCHSYRRLRRVLAEAVHWLRTDLKIARDERGWGSVRQGLAQERLHEMLDSRDSRVARRRGSRPRATQDPAASQKIYIRHAIVIDRKTGREFVGAHSDSLGRSYCGRAN
jgi:hypothetical protein